MRFGMSWPVGRGRRQWISVGPVAALVLLPFWLLWMGVWGLIVLAAVAAAALSALLSRRSGA